MKRREKKTPPKKPEPRGSKGGLQPEGGKGNGKSTTQKTPPKNPGEGTDLCRKKRYTSGAKPKEKKINFQR